MASYQLDVLKDEINHICGNCEKLLQDGISEKQMKHLIRNTRSMAENALITVEYLMEQSDKRISFFKGEPEGENEMPIL